MAINRTVATICFTRWYFSALSTSSSALRTNTDSSLFIFLFLLNVLADSSNSIGKARLGGSNWNIENRRCLLDREMLLIMQQEDGSARRRCATHQLQEIKLETFALG